jgi:hypothetical protein
MATDKKPKTQPRLVVPQESPSPEENSVATVYQEPARDFDPRKANQVLLSDLINPALLKRGVPAPVAAELSNDLAGVIGKAASKVPSWVIYLAVSFGAPALYAFYETWQSVEALPPRVANVEKIQEEQGKQLDRIEALLQGSTSRPRY